MMDGMAAAKKRDWETAVRHFGRAEKLSPLSPQVLFNLALANDNAGNRELFAIAWYRAYLAVAPKAGNAGQARARIADLETRIEDRVRSFVPVAREAITATELPGYRSVASETLVRIQAKTGDIEGAKKTAHAITPGILTKADAFVSIALIQIWRGDINGACDALDIAAADIRLSMTNRAIDREGSFTKRSMASYLEALKKAVEELTKAGNIEKAKKTAASIDSAKYPDETGWAYRTITQAQAKAGDTEGAGKTSDGIKSQGWKALAVSDVVFFQAKAGDVAGALKRAGAMADNAEALRRKAESFYYIAHHQVQAGDNVGARRTLALALAPADRIPATMSSDKAHSYKYIAGCQADAKDIQGSRQTVAKALEAAARLSKGSDRDKFFSDIAQIQAKSKDVKEAKTTAARIDSRHYRAWALILIAREETKAGDPSGARQTLAQALSITGEITDQNQKSTIYQAVAEEQVNAGDPSGAKKTAGAISSDHRKYLFYKFLTAKQTKAGDPESAGRSREEMEQALMREESLFWQNKIVMDRLNTIYPEGKHAPLESLKGRKSEDIAIFLTARVEQMAAELNLMREKAEEWKKVWTEAMEGGARVR